MILANKVIIVTGAAGGLGREFSLKFAAEGALVAAADLKDCAETAELVRAAGGECISLTVNVADADSVAQMCKAVKTSFGGIDGLVNNAAIYAGLKMAPFDEISEAEWDAVMTVNAKGVWMCCREAVAYMRERGGGSIVNISSASVLEGNPYFAHYVASKGAVWALTRSISRSVGEHKIRVNSIMPGYTMTDASRGLAGDPESFKKNYDDNIAARAIPRAMEPEDVIGAATFLLSDMSAFITGQNINIDGGSRHY